MFSEAHGINRLEQSCSKIALCGPLDTLGQEAAIHLLGECKRVLIPGGVLRFAATSLEAVVEAYAKGMVPQYAPGEPDPPISPAQAINRAFKRQGFLWDMDDIGVALDFHGFDDWYPCERNRSEYDELRGIEPLEAYPFPIHVYEAVK